MGKDNKINIIKDLVSGGSIGIKNFIIPAIDVLVAQRPEFIPAWILARGFFGSIFDIQQDKINEFVDYIKNNPSIFIKEIVSTEEFQEGFLITFEEYLKQRTENKRKIIQEIFSEFTQSENKINFELERMYDVLNKLMPSNFKLLMEMGNGLKKTFSNHRRIESNAYEEIKYLEYLGLVNCKKEQDVEVGIAEEDESPDAYFTEEELFSISTFGYNFVKFLKEPINK